MFDANAYAKKYRLTEKGKEVRHKSDAKYLKSLKWAKVVKKHKLKSKYGLTMDEFHAMLEEQHNKCAICLEPVGKRRLCVDHCHKTNMVRGLICNNCNHVLGNSKEKIEVLQRTILYIIRYIL